MKLAEQFRPFEKELKFDFENNFISEKELSQWNDYLTLKEKVDSEVCWLVKEKKVLETCGGPLWTSSDSLN